MYKIWMMASISDYILQHDRHGKFAFRLIMSLRQSFCKVKFLGSQTALSAPRIWHERVLLKLLQSIQEWVSQKKSLVCLISQTYCLLLRFDFCVSINETGVSRSSSLHTRCCSIHDSRSKAASIFQNPPSWLSSKATCRTRAHVDLTTFRPTASRSLQ